LFINKSASGETKTLDDGPNERSIFVEHYQRTILGEAKGTHQIEEEEVKVKASFAHLY
jgi:hypothetical protein